MYFRLPIISTTLFSYSVHVLKQHTDEVVLVEVAVFNLNSNPDFGNFLG